MVKTKSGITKVYFAELSKEVQERFHYDPEKATAYAADQTANYATYQKQQEEALRQKAEASQKANQVQAERENRQNQIRTLQARHDQLQKQEDDLLLQIGEAKQPGPAYQVGKKLQHHPNPQKSQLPVLQSHLSDIRSEKKKLRKQLDKAQQ
jgi:chromosome segregation ATPase